VIREIPARLDALVPARTLVVGRVELFVLIVPVARHLVSAATIGAIDHALLAELQEDARVAKRPAAAVAGDAVLLHQDGLGRGQGRQSAVILGNPSGWSTMILSGSHKI
jgi:hypothetical protein